MNDLHGFIVANHDLVESLLLTPVQRRILDYIATHPVEDCFQKCISGDLGLSQPLASYHLRQLVSKGYLKTPADLKRGRTLYYERAYLLCDTL